MLAVFFCNSITFRDCYNCAIYETREVVEYPLARAAKEQAAADRFFEEQRNMQSPDMGKPAWNCASCGEENPGNFEVCWKCQAARAAADSGKDAGK